MIIMHGNPIIFDSLVKQYWSTATLRAPELGPAAILATIDKTSYTITEELVRSRLQLADDGGIADLPILEIYSGMDNLGYVTEGKLTFFKNKFSPQWRGMVSNIRNAKKFLMYPRFLQTILGIETRVTRQYKVLTFSSKLFANMRLNFAGYPMPLLLAMLLQAQVGGGAEVAKQAIPHPMPSPDHSPSPLPTPSRPQASNPTASVLEHDHGFDPHVTVAGPFPSREDTPLGGDFHTTPLRSSHAPSVGQPSGGAKDPITLTALSFVVSTFVQKVHSLEAKLHDHKKLFKDVVGKLVKKVKTLEVKMKTKKRKMVVSDSDQEDDTTQNVDLDALCALANAAVAVVLDIPAASPRVPTIGPSDTSGVPPATSVIPLGASDAPTGASINLLSASNVFAAASAVPADSLNIPADVPADSTHVTAGVSNKGKYLMVYEDIPIKARMFRQMEDDRLGEEAAKRLHEEDMAQMEREREKAQRKRQQETLLGDDVSEETFPARMVALIKKKRQALAEQLFKERQNRPLTPTQQKAYMRQYVKNQSSAIYNTGWTMAYVKSFFDEQLKQEFEKILTVQSHSQIQAFSQTLKRPGPVLVEPSTKRPKSPEAPTPSIPEVTISPAVTSPPSSRTRRKSLGRKHIHKPKLTPPKLDLDAPAQTFLKVVVDEDSDDEDFIDEVWSVVVRWETFLKVVIDEDSDDEDFIDEVWSVVVRWEVLPTPLGEINALYRIDGSTKHFATLRQILHMVDRHDLMKLYGLVVQYYEHHPAAGAGLLFRGDLQEIQSWRLYTLSNVHVLETVSGEVLSMFTDVSYPLSVKLIERMLMHKLEIDLDFVGNDLTTAEQLIQFIKNQFVAAQASSI
nr:aminoacyl-tRNA synthetase, class 1a, anticodon-binding [Tanacetum cinerariifolium]